jgi:molybdenum cofactor cytidylyltransferase
MTAGALIVAAGFSRRFGSDKRRYALADGDPLLLATVKVYSEVFPSVAVVLRNDDGPLADDLLRGLEHQPPIIVTTDLAHLGMAHSLADGVRAVASWDYLFVALGDMPFVAPTTLGELRQKMSDARHRGEALIVRPRCDNRAGHPVGFSCEYFSELMSLSGDDGARPVLEAHCAELEHLDTTDRGVLIDIDQPWPIEIDRP